MASIGLVNNSIRPIDVGTSQQPQGTRSPEGKAEFRSALQSLQQEALAKLPATAASNGLKFSNHAIERMQSRGISFTPDQLNKLAGAVEKAASKGSKNALLLSDTSAMIVSVKDNTVVTVMDRAGMKDNVFTNIDSTVMV